jgi:hypothetical protein
MAPAPTFCYVVLTSHAALIRCAMPQWDRESPGAFFCREYRGFPATTPDFEAIAAGNPLAERELQER